MKTDRKLIINVVGARPNFVKMAPIVKEMKRKGLEQILVHTGQHYDRKMSDVFFTDLDFPEPDIYLKAGSASHAVQTADIMLKFEQVCLERKPALVVVSGDINSTLACALTAAKLQIPVAHIESGLRSFDRTMPEEINRIMTDHLSDFLFITEKSGLNNLIHEGIDPSKMFDVGNTMIDSLKEYLPLAKKQKAFQKFNLREGQYGLVTLHRPANVDNANVLIEIADTLANIDKELPLIFPIHPRTQKMMAQQGVSWGGIQLVEPLGYLEFLSLMSDAKIVFTDSGGIQEETASLNVPCVTVRENTERPVTVEHGGNIIAGCSGASIFRAYEKLMSQPLKPEKEILLWDGRAAQRVVDVIEKYLSAE